MVIIVEQFPNPFVTKVIVVLTDTTILGFIQEKDVFNDCKIYHSFLAGDGGLREVVWQLMGCLCWTCSFVLVDWLALQV